MSRAGRFVLLRRLLQFWTLIVGIVFALTLLYNNGYAALARDGGALGTNVPEWTKQIVTIGPYGVIWPDLIVIGASGLVILLLTGDFSYSFLATAFGGAVFELQTIWFTWAYTRGVLWSPSWWPEWAWTITWIELALASVPILLIAARYSVRVPRRNLMSWVLWGSLLYYAGTFVSFVLLPELTWGCYLAYMQHGTNACLSTPLTQEIFGQSGRLTGGVALGLIWVRAASKRK